MSREKWFENSIRKLASADIIFIDPDNGIPTDKVNKTQKKAAKYVFKDEIERYYNLGKSIIIYNHRDRKPSPEYNKKILSSINMGTEIRVLRFKKVSVRDYIFLIQKPHYDLIDQTINHLLNEPYGFLFEPYNLEYQVYQFKITLEGIRPPIWRRIQVPETYTFWDLHVAIQDSMGWMDYHLHEFEIRNPTNGIKVTIGLPDDEFPKRNLLGWAQKIACYFSLENPSADYIYDFGDYWVHRIKLEKILPKEVNFDDPAARLKMALEPV